MRLTGPISNEQKARICILAREAAAHMGLTFESDAAFQQWRHEEQEKACGKGSLRNAIQDDYLPLKAHFLNLAGKVIPAMTSHLRHQQDPKRVAFFKLAEACDKADLKMEYASRICRTQFKCSLNEASPKQLWNLVYTIRNRDSARKKKADCPF